MPRRAQLVVAVTLALVAGCVDAVSFDRIFQVFPANQSGNAVLLGIGIGAGHADEAWRPAAAIAGFMIGVAGAVIVGDRVSRLHRPTMLLGIESALLTALTIALVAVERPRALSGPASGALLVLAAVAMGIQTEVIGRVAGVTVATTYQSGAIARIADVTGRRPERPEGLTADAPPPGLAVLGSVLLAYIAGATLGAALVAVLDDHRGAMVVPTALVVALTAGLAIGTSRTDRPIL
jgi:uncharacterized membrane protein YoaK (UPF0700 family)